VMNVEGAVDDGIEGPTPGRGGALAQAADRRTSEITHPMTYSRFGAAAIGIASRRTDSGGRTAGITSSMLLEPARQ
jgi:hypothetical protein